MIERVMLFIDGDNLVARYQALLRQGRSPAPEVVHEPDLYVWRPNDYLLPIRNNVDVTRATIYVSVAGDEVLLRRTAETLRSLGVLHSEYAPRLFPKVFRKTAGTLKAKAIDTQLSVDAVAAVLRDQLDILYFMTGDGDFTPVLQEAVRAGKKVWVGAFSDGLNPRLRECSDLFVHLDSFYFHPATQRIGAPPEETPVA